MKVISSENPLAKATCIICLQDNPKPRPYAGNCACHPCIHEACLEKWLVTNKDKCPICLHSNKTIIKQPERHNEEVACCMIFCICCIPLLSLLP